MLGQLLEVAQVVQVAQGGRELRAGELGVLGDDLEGGGLSGRDVLGQGVEDDDGVDADVLVVDGLDEQPLGGVDGRGSVDAVVVLDALAEHVTAAEAPALEVVADRKSTRLNSSH